jgi:hypothetical protein
MGRDRPVRSVAGVFTAMFILGFLGCDATKQAGESPIPKADGRASKPTSAEDADATNPSKLMADWPTDRFAGALLLSGEMVGYHEPCGCTADQKGGLIRRSIFIELLRKQGWNLALLDLGSLVADPSKSRDGPNQTRLKLGLTIEALKKMGYGALALSAEDLRPGTADTLMQFQSLLESSDEPLKVVSANAIPTPDLGFEKMLRPNIRTTVGPVKVGVTSVLDPAAFEALKDTGKSDLLTIKPPEETLPAVLADLETDTNIQVLMVQGPPELARRLALQFPGFDLVVSTHPFPDPPDKPEILNDGKTWLVTTGRKGMYVGVVGLFLDPKEKFRYQRVELNKRYDQYLESASSMRELIGDEFQKTLKDMQVLETYPRLPYALFNAPAGASFVGAESCRDCHPKTFAHWQSTKHAQGYEPLVSDPHDAARNRENDAACVSCHTVGFEYQGGFVTLDKNPELKGVQCESCHGPGSAHVEDSKDARALEAIKRSAEDFQRNHRCIQCHDEDNDPKFDWEKYWPQIDHKGLDTKRAT